MEQYDLLTIYVFVVAISEILGVLSAVQAIMQSRTSQGAIAWAVSLVLFPLFAVPLYWVFGSRKLHGCLDARRAGDLHLAAIAEDMTQDSYAYRRSESVDEEPFHSIQKLTRFPFYAGNSVSLLIDGDQTFEAMFAAIEQARSYIIVQTFIIRDDELGGRLRELLIRKAREGCHVYLLYDAFGSRNWSRKAINALEEAGAYVEAFAAAWTSVSRFQFNFRNHRKITIVDGKTAFVGGLNIGDEYLGRNAKFGPWRDTHVQLSGPAVQAVQLTFVEDWYWATGTLPQLNWRMKPNSEGDYSIAVHSTGPADELDTCTLFFVQAINSAKDRVWIASPYFVPDESVVTALQLAALRGVDVRIMLPQKPDHLLVYLSGFYYVDAIAGAGVKFFRYQQGFMHHKVLLVDDNLSAVGTVNLDNRSLHLNFEITLVFAGNEFAGSVAEMLARDFQHCHQTTPDDLRSRSYLFQVSVRIARLFSPIQ